MTIHTVNDPGEIAELYRRRPDVHAYGLADLDEPFWSHSTWQRRSCAVVGVLNVPDAQAAIVYAIAAEAASDTLALLADLAPSLPDRFVITGPVGVARTLSTSYRTAWSGRHEKMLLVRPEQLVPSPDASPIGPNDLAPLNALFATDTRGDRFFVPQLLGQGTYRGIWSGAQLVAVAGTHVVSELRGVAAIGNVVTHPEHRRRGLAARTTSAVARHLLDRVDTVGLNVDATDPGPRRLYAQLGFEVVHDYEEAELVRGAAR